MRKTFVKLLRRADWDWPGACVYADWQIEEFARGALDRLIKLGIIKEGPPGRRVRCDKCAEGCRIEPVIRDLPAGPIGYYVCKQNEEVGGFVVEKARFRRWEFQFQGLATLVAKTIKVTGGIKEDVADRIAFLGTVIQHGKGRDVFLARGLTWSDTAEVLKRATRLQAAKGPIIIVPERLPAKELFRGTATMVRSLAEIATVTARTFKVDTARLLCSDVALVVTQGEPTAEQTEAVSVIEMDILEALASNSGKTMIQVEISTAAGYSRSAIQDGLKRLRRLGLIAKPSGTKRKGFALTEKGLVLVNASRNK